MFEKVTVINSTQDSSQMLSPKKESFHLFYWQMILAEPVLPFSLRNNETGISGFFRLKNQITMNYNNNRYKNENLLNLKVALMVDELFR